MHEDALTNTTAMNELQETQYGSPEEKYGSREAAKSRR